MEDTPQQRSLAQLGPPLRAVQSIQDPAACQGVSYQNNCLRLFQARGEQHSLKLKKQRKIRVTKKVLVSRKGRDRDRIKINEVRI